MSRVDHWDGVYATRSTHEVSWYQVRPETSLRLIGTLGIQPADPIIDVGGGASNLVDHLIEEGFRSLTVLDISSSAIEAVKARLGAQAKLVKWLCGDITEMELPGPYRLWHDRAVFHFLTDPGHRAIYVRSLRDAVAKGGYLIMATFADDGPTQCSNLPVCRYSPEQLAAELGDGFQLLESLRETHMTPAQGQQKFIYCCFRRN